MVYIISSTTPWPAKRDNSINLLYEFKKESSPFIWFASYLISYLEDDYRIISKNEYNDNNQSNYIYNESLEIIQKSYNIGDFIEGPLFSSFSIKDSEDIEKYKDYINRAKNFYELFEGTQKDNIWHNLEKMVQLALTQTKTEIDAFFIRLSFFPKIVLTNLIK